jgi:hypothetical protein
MAKHKLMVSLDDQARATLSQLREDTGASSDAEVLRTAVGLLAWAVDQRRAGFAVCAFVDGVPTREVSIPLAHRELTVQENKTAR